MITGGAKFFEGNYAWSVAGGSVAVSSGTAAQANLIDKDRQSYWYSVASDDSTVETITLTFPSTAINRLFALDINWKLFTCKYWNGSAFVNFTNSVGMDGAMGSGIISETAFADNCAYYEVDTVTTTRIQWKVTQTQLANAQKYCAELVATLELGTFQGYPQVKAADVNRNQREIPNLSGRVRVLKSTQTIAFTLGFQGYPRSAKYLPDLDLMYALLDRDTPFYIWPCGGRRGTKYYGYTLRGHRLLDLTYVQLCSNIAGDYNANITTNSVNLTDLTFKEHA